MTPDTLLGTWHLRSMETVFEDGTRSQPYGMPPDGRLHYAADGTVYAHLWDPARHVMGHQPGPDAVYFSYTGTWHLDGSRVLHQVAAATYPDWTGREIMREAHWDGETLRLTAPVVFEGKPGLASLAWRRAGA